MGTNERMPPRHRDGLKGNERWVERGGGLQLLHADMNCLMSLPWKISGNPMRVEERLGRMDLGTSGVWKVVVGWIRTSNLGRES
ncbi:hypothetical protein AVEN_260300-1 [Araneus ventricosus]|uniref:Uncharacterized protein n=1 Tax=Araneus ventricosus TaxID=182803 RepID=A0A4Y2J0D2_ARAVE|nr:hypothetical protein AVEN_260300-1 [Araneus ventricosus]